MTIDLVLTKEGEECTCKDPWSAHEAFRWTPPADGTSHMIIEIKKMAETQRT